MNNSEFVTVRGQNLLANSVWAGEQEFLIVPIPIDGADSATAETCAQQNIEIVPGLKIKEKKSGQEFKILSKPMGYYKQVEIQDIYHMQLSLHVLEAELRQNYQFVG